MKYIRYLYYWLIGSFFYPTLVWADPTNGSDSPFPTIDIKGGDVVAAVGTHMESGMKYAMVGGGVIMMLAGIGVIMHRLREDSTNRDSGSFIMTLILAGIAITIGIVLITIGWSAASYDPSAQT